MYLIEKRRWGTVVARCENPDQGLRNSCVFCRLSREKIEVHHDAVSERLVIPAKAGIHRQYEAWIPAFAGMTIRSEMESK
ncbi:hypothetical protein GCM10010981_11770 [Dyella nitratireducens]|uniref:Uncharacterized protein n=1 Tax=Dyella nitratireducens TaxID=1849580 RepID=A0ABQ1FR81_9GAMM|nr:hypothetical protein GCM10010981_11770 [Dyella nitratireducens]GLQ43761.1 hypothetical protein GCM10007902_36110 [Dyella nitratireducens]